LDLLAVINGVFADDAVRAIIIACSVLTGADFIVGVGAAFGTGTFKGSEIAAFIQSHVLARLLPILTVAVLGHFYAPLFAIAGLASAAYVVETLASIRNNLLGAVS
jgi:hypothetical protein